MAAPSKSLDVERVGYNNPGQRGKHPDVNEALLTTPEFLPSILCLAVVGGLTPLKLWIKIKPSPPQLSCSVFHWRHATVGASKSSQVRQNVPAYIDSMGEGMLRSVDITWT